MAGPREKGAPHQKAKAVPLTAGGRRPARETRPIERFTPGIPTSRSPTNPLELPSVPIPFRLKVPHLANLATVTNRPGGPLAKFGLFRRLPAELRHMIWKYLLPGPNIVTVYVSRDGRKESYKFSSTLVAPRLLWTCHEAREVVLLRYKRNAFKHPKSVNGCFFNFEQDILDFQSWAMDCPLDGIVATHGQRTRWLSHRAVEADIRNVKYMAFAHIALMRELDTTRRYRPLPLPTFLHFSSLQKVVIVFTFRHTWGCAQCQNSEMPLNDHLLVDDAKMVVGELKQDLVEGKTYSFMFGNEWMPPKWEWRMCCAISDWKRPYLESLVEPVRVEEMEEGDTMVNETVGASDTSPAGAASPMDTTPGESVATSSSENASILDTTPLLTEGESAASTSSPDTPNIMDTTEGESASSTSTSSETESMMDMTEGESVSSRTSFETASMMGNRMENLRDGD
ncbi:uncharacterized protein K444DRAFT_700449 [Hyaloscypha bicolor E]|uniref:2EXR domain-containing protein n=1 Tax=Hyaloscypha bicolor E TaxID=1095630 RepID=A0A2J6SSL5_9HELO|nr:uncharacterized protein K444DRAFT_700449 [Hyaloscypha bicolor E]PMD53740.1 hypothetical protein K444DRAFT_700449 [Hyaloscypha bicolor E]